MVLLLGDIEIRTKVCLGLRQQTAHMHEQRRDTNGVKLMVVCTSVSRQDDIPALGRIHKHQ